MDRISKLRLLINQLDDYCLEHGCTDKDFKYIGTGNPNADILIIGKEAAICDSCTMQIDKEITSNFDTWKEKTDYNQENVIRSTKLTDYDPLYPYKGQIKKINNDKNNGTSRTWYTYQKLIDNIFGITGNNEINFHEKVFLTEVNPKPSQKTKDANTDLIEKRKEIFLRSEFIQSFPVVIISGVGYFSITPDFNEIEEIFNVKFFEKKNGGNKLSQPYWIHYGKSQSPRILINTHQLSIGISDALLMDVANDIVEIKDIKTTFSI